MLKSLHNGKTNTGAFEGGVGVTKLQGAACLAELAAVCDRLRILSPIVERILENPGASPHRKTQKNIFFLLKRAVDKEINFIFCCFLAARAKNIFQLLAHTRKQCSEKYFGLSNAENRKIKNRDHCFPQKTGMQERGIQ